MQLHQLKYVVKASQYQNFSMAAKELFITQPTLSQQIKRLEEELGISLFFRHPKSVSLTSAGEEFVLYAKRVLNDLDALYSSMKDFQTLSRGKLTIGALWVIGYLEQSHTITRFIQDHPHLDVHVIINGSNNLYQMLLERAIDAAILIGNESFLSNEELCYKKLADDRFMVIVSNRNPLSRKKSIHISDLQYEKIIMPSPDSTLRKKIMTLFQSQDITPNIICDSSQSDTSTQLASQNFGVAFSSESISRQLENGQYQAIPLIPSINRPIYLAALKSVRDYPTVRELIRYFTGESPK